MDGSQFDRFARDVADARSRRGIIKVALGAVLGAVVSGRTVDAASLRKLGEVCREHANCATGVCGSPDRNNRRVCGCSTGNECPQSKDVCQVATCNRATGTCGTAPKPDSTPCPDTRCRINQTCTSGVCGGGTAVVCPGSSDKCIVTSCDPKVGCVNTRKNCNDGNVCTIDGCNAETGECFHKPISCDDGNPCTSDSCDPIDGCRNVPLTAEQLDDNNACTKDYCLPNRGIVHEPIVCSNPDKCFKSSCDPIKGCIDTPIDCNDNNPCTIDTCVDGFCIYTPKSCNDGNKCTIDTCDVTTGECVHTPKDCNDFNACTRDTCDVVTGNCVNTPISCTDGNPCTVDTCDPVTGCVNTPKYHISQLEADDKCNRYSCDPQTGNLIKTPVSCDDNNPCTVDTCNPLTGECIFAECDDADLCPECQVDD